MCNLHCYSFPLSKHTGGGDATLLSQASVFTYSSRGWWAFPPLLWSFPPTATFTSFPTPGCWACATAPAFSSQLLYLEFWEGFPLPPLWRSGHPALFATCLFCCYCLLFRVFFFFPWVGVSLSRGLCWSDPGLSVEYRVPLISPCGLPSSQAVWELASGSPGALLVSLFNVKWRCYAQAGGVEESKFCLFLVIFPVRCISSVSPRFYFSRHAFCFLPLAAILESSPCIIFLRRMVSIPYFFPLLHLVLCNYVFDRLVGFSCLFSFPWFNFWVAAVLVVS
jgi:hypothetical protein